MLCRKCARQIEAMESVTKDMSIREIIVTVSKGYNVTYEEIMSGDKTKRVSMARHAAIRSVKEHRPMMTYNAIGRRFNRDHSTVMHALGYVRPSRRKRHD